jgi:hypothetical protein
LYFVRYHTISASVAEARARASIISAIPCAPPDDSKAHTKRANKNNQSTMADEDEDLSHLRAPEPQDVDLSDETQDFRFLDKLV